MRLAHFITLLSSAAAALGSPTLAGRQPLSNTTLNNPRLEPLKYTNTSRLRIAYYEAGPASGPPVLLLHGWPYDIHSYTQVAPALASAGYRVIVPYLRGNGPTTFLRRDTFRSGEQAALGADVIDLLDTLHIPRAILAGYDWGGRGANVACALHPDRCAGLVSVNSYQIQDLDHAWQPLDVPIEAGFWYFYYFLTPRGEAALASHPKDIARLVWTRNSPQWNYTEADLDRAAETFENPDYVSIVTHVYRHRLFYAPGDPDYAEAERKLRKLPPITVPAVTLDGLADGNFPATDGTPSAKYFTGPRVHHKVEGAGHNLPQEKPQAFVDAVLEVAKLAKVSA
ncbi:Alpha/Beta hydrolase protein [Parachaetomium inaequale]|uniref:Alpha/Beta hydrolase protein n=1 Tax=Parachaetomium inaequale TaxID=2588326 RepID=A0AAN6PAQ8_9PEZI|nr:Alpha/Beta hydrolase protein [Parachaetomium inaequale]